MSTTSQRIRFFTLLALVHLLKSALAVNATCYLRSGEIAPLNEPCDPNADVSHCCEKDKHICFSNKLCLDTGANHFIEGGCTDQTWDDPSCPQYCAGTLVTAYGDVRQCDNSNTDWVCGTDPSDCSSNFTIPQGYIDDRRVEAQTAIVNLPAAYTASGTTPVTYATDTPTATPTSASTALATACPAANSQGNDSGSSTLAVGLGAGLGVGLPLLIALATALFFLRRSNRQLKELRSGQGATYQTHIYQNNGVAPQSPFEKPASPTSRPQEMAS